MRPVVTMALLVGLAMAPRGARAADKQTCVDAHEAAQVSRRDGRWLDARRALLTCLSPECPPILQRECAPWLVSLEEALPSLLVVVRDEQGADVPGAAVTVDGATPASLAVAVPLDPGERLVRAAAAGFVTAERRLLLREGDRNVRVELILRPAALGPPRGLSSVPATPNEAKAPFPWAPVALGGTAVLALGVFGVVGATAKADERELARTCAPRCSDEAIQSVERRYLVADVALGVALVSAAAAVVTWALAPRATPSPQRHSGL